MPYAQNSRVVVGFVSAAREVLQELAQREGYSSGWARALLAPVSPCSLALEPPEAPVWVGDMNVQRVDLLYLLSRVSGEALGTPAVLPLVGVLVCE